MDRVAIETTGGEVVGRLDPRAAFEGHAMNSPWDPLHRSYFNGYALWTYLTTPFFMAMPDFEVAEIEPWRKVMSDDAACDSLSGQRSSHCRDEEFYFGPDFLLRRHGSRVDVAGSVSAAQYVHDIMDVDGLKFPSRRRASCADLTCNRLAICYWSRSDLSNFRLDSELPQHSG